MFRKVVALMLCAAMLVAAYPATADDLAITAPIDVETAAPSEDATEALEDAPVIVTEEVPTEAPTEEPVEQPTVAPTEEPVELPTEAPTEEPVELPTEAPTEEPVEQPTDVPTEEPTEAPTDVPTEEPTEAPTDVPTEEPTETPTDVPTEEPTEAPTNIPTEEPTEAPTDVPTEEPTEAPTDVPTEEPTEIPTELPTEEPELTPEPLPLEIALSVGVRSAFAGDTVTLTLTVAGGAGQLSAACQVLNGQQTIANDAMLVVEGENIYAFSPAAYGEHTIRFVVTDEAGQTAEASATLPVAEHDTTSLDQWTKLAKAVKLTDSWQENLIAVAKSQIGYIESATDFIILEDGRHAYSIYGDWMKSNYAEWSAAFVSFCMEYANIPSTAFPRSATVEKLLSGAKGKGIFESAGDYAPAAGDVVFFKDENHQADRAGVVIAVSQTGLRVAEGRNGAVSTKTYAQNDPTILGYAHIAQPVQTPVPPMTTESLEAAADDEYGIMPLVNLTAGDYTLNFSSYSGVSIVKYNGSDTNVVIPGYLIIDNVYFPITSIESKAFEGCTTLRYLTIPETISELGNAAFKDCVNLRTVDILGDVGRCNSNSTSSTSSSSYAVFYNAGANSGSLTVTFGDNVTTIPDFLFATGSSQSAGNYAHVTNVVLGSRVTSIGKYAFYNCYDLKTFTWNSTLTDIKDYAFQNCAALTSVTIPASVMNVGHYAFRSCTSLKTLVINAETVQLGSAAFGNCPALSSITINGNVKDCLISSTRSDYANYSVFYNAGANASSLSVTFGPNVTTVPDYLFATAGSQAAGDYAHVTKVTLGSRITSIGVYAFYHCYDLASLTIPASVASVERHAFDSCAALKTLVINSETIDFGFAAFKDCTALSSVTINGNVSGATISSSSSNDYSNYAIFSNAGAKASSLSVTFGANVTAVPNYLFATGGSQAADDYAHVTKVTFGSKIQTIGAYAFYHCYDLTSVTIPDGVISVGEHAFDSCASLKTLIINAKNIQLGNCAFKDCTGLNYVTINEDIKEASSYSARATSGVLHYSNYSVFSNAGASASALVVTFGPNVTKTPAYLFATAGTKAAGDYAHVTKVVLGNKVATVGQYSFYHCYDLKTITWNDMVSGIEMYAFSNCAVTSLNLPASLIEVGQGAFESNTSLKTLVINADARLYNAAFKNCTGLSAITINGNLADCPSESINSDYSSGNRAVFTNAGADSSSLTVTFGPKVTKIPVFLFATGATQAAGDYAHVTDLVIGSSVESISGYAFYHCFDLKDVEIPSNVLAIYSYAFGISTLENITIKNSLCTLYTNAIIANSPTFHGASTSSAQTYASQHGYAFEAIKPAIPKVTNVAFNNGDVTVYWASVPDAISYSLHYRIESGDWKELPSSHTDTSCVLSGAVPGTTYSFSVRCFDSSYTLSDFDPVGATFTYLEAPKLSTITCDTTGIRLTWDKVPGAAKYRVYFKKSPSDEWTKLADTTATSYSHASAAFRTEYTYTVRCISADGNSILSDMDETGLSYTRVPAPTVSAVEHVVSGIKITWNAVSGAGKYRVYYKTGSGSWTMLTDTAATSYTWTGGISGTTYAFTVRCLNAAGNQFLSGYDTTGVSINYLATPKITSVAGDNAGIKITWGAVPGAVMYRVYYRNANTGGAWTKLLDTPDTSCLRTGAVFGTPYTFAVRCVSTDGKQLLSSMDPTGVTITRVAAPKVSKVENVVNGIRITWGKVSGAGKYRVYYKTASASGWSTLTDTTDTTYTWTGAQSGTTYAFTVRCLSEDNKQFTSGYDTTGVSIDYLAAPKITTVAGDNAGIRITWGAVPGAVMYRVYYRNANTGGAWTKLLDTPDTSCIRTGAVFGTPYTFAVRCVSADGKVLASAMDPAGVTITRVAAPKVSKVENVDGGIKITWGKVSGAGKYRVYYRTTDTTTWSTLANTTDNTYTWTGGTVDVEYAFTVRCLSEDFQQFTSGYDTTGVSVVYQ